MKKSYLHFHALYVLPLPNSRIFLLNIANFFHFIRLLSMFFTDFPFFTVCFHCVFVCYLRSNGCIWGKKTMILTKPKSENAGPSNGTGGRRSTLKTLVCSTRSNAPREEKVAERLSKMGIDSFVLPFSRKFINGATVVR